MVEAKRAAEAVRMADTVAEVDCISGSSLAYWD
jgi:hypothetical protein